MADIVDIRDKLPHYSGAFKCLNCSHAWEGYVPMSADFWHLPCPQCYLDRAVAACNAQPQKDEIYRGCSNCGRDLWYIVQGTDNVVYMLCASCAQRTAVTEVL